MIFQLLGISKGEVFVELSALTLAPGMRVPGRALFRAGDQPRAVRWFRVLLQMVSTTPRPGPMGLEFVRDTRLVVAPIELSQPFTLGPGQQLEFHFELQLPAAMLPTVPGHLEYELWASAHVEGDLLDCSQMLRLLVAPAHGAPVPNWAAPWSPPAQYSPPPTPYSAPQWGSAPRPLAPPAAPPLPAPAAPAPLAQGASVRAQSHEGQWADAMVVQTLGALVLVQWLDGRAATWVRPDQVKLPEPPAAPPAPTAPPAPETPPAPAAPPAPDAPPTT